MIPFFAKPTCSSRDSHFRRGFRHCLQHRLTLLFIAACTVLFAQTLDTLPVKAESSDHPNIVFILADDLGYGELGCYGQEKIKTPHLDRLASQGMRMMQHYAGAPVCAPSRCTLLTGQHLGHAEIRGNRDSGNGRRFPGQWPITDEIVTLAETLKAQGYATGGFGKWGLGPTDSTGGPNRQGFDRFFGYNCQRNAHSYYPPFLDSDEGIETINDTPIPGHQRKPEGDILADDYRSDVYAPDRILSEAVDWLDEHHDQPFFLYLPFVEPHVSMQPPQQWIDQYPVQWDETVGVYRGQNGYLPHPRPRAAYAAMISDLDEHVGTILARLDHHGLNENTLVVFSSDNGPTHGASDPRFEVGGAGSTFFNSTSGLKGFKGSCYEGGLRVPCLVSWPGKITPGSQSELASYFPDWFPTITAVCGGELPNNQPVDGIDLSPELFGQATPLREQPMIWEFNDYGGILAVRQGDWKAVRLNTKQKRAGDWELYNIATDPAESKDVAAQHPEIVASLAAALMAHRTTEPDFPQPLLDQ